MIIDGEDGITHINIYSMGKTTLGMWLSNFSYCPIVIPSDGKFNSIEGYWYWLSTRDEGLRGLSGFEAKKLGKSLEKKYTIDNFEEKVKLAIDIKIKSNPMMMKMLYESSLPFCHYYSYGGKKKGAGYEWIVEHIENRRFLLKNHFGNEK
jgi:hypothetical protein